MQRNELKAFYGSGGDASTVELFNMNPSGEILFDFLRYVFMFLRCAMERRWTRFEEEKKNFFFGYDDACIMAADSGNKIPFLIWFDLITVQYMY